MIRRIVMTASAMACGAAGTLIIQGGSIREIAGAACVSIALVIAATILPDLRRKAMDESKKDRRNFNFRLM